MTEAEARTAVRTTVAVMAQLASRTRTKADNLMAQILHNNEDRLAAVVHKLSQAPDQPATPEQIAAALAEVGIRA